MTARLQNTTIGPLVLTLPPTLQVTATLFKVWAHRHRTRKQLGDLLLNDPARLTYDLGITVQCAQTEIAKPFWQA